jgi:hypothetical protein
MRDAHEEFPEYNFGKHKGYATQAHWEAIRDNGPCKIHRFWFPAKHQTCWMCLHTNVQLGGQISTVGDILNAVNQSPITHHLQTGYDALDCLGGNKILPQGDPLFSLPRADFMGNVLCFSSAG